MGYRILLVDDEPCTVLVMKHGLQRFGYEVTCAGDGEEAWAAVGEGRPDVILADYRMPRLDGLELAARLKGDPATADIPLILFTCKGFELSEADLRRQFGVAAMLPKPFNPRVYARVIEQTVQAEDRA